jgi:hypothetical protein
MYERQLLRELEALRVDVSGAAKKVVPAANGAPKPTVIPPLENFSETPSPLPRPTTAPVSNGFQQHSPHMQSPPLTSQPGPSTQQPHPQAHSAQGPLFFPSQHPQSQKPLSASSTQSSFPSPPGPLSPSSLPGPQIPAQSPGAGPSAVSQDTRARPSVSDPPLGGRFVDGTKSMFVKSTQPPHPSPTPTSVSSSSSFSGRPQQHSQVASPLHNDPLGRPVADPLSSTPSRVMNVQATLSNGVDPLGHFKPGQMSSSMRVQPTRPRLDPREAASKLANMF